MRPVSHIIYSLAISSAIYAFFHSLAAFFISLAGGILIDIDHLFDYYLQKGLTLRIGQVYKWYTDRKCRLVVIIFHSLELLLALWLGISFFKMGVVWVAFAVGITQHLLLDMFFNPTYPYAFFFSYRIIKKFRIEAIERPVTLKGQHDRLS